MHTLRNTALPHITLHTRTYILTYRHTCIQTDRQAEKQRDIAYIHTYIHQIVTLHYITLPYITYIHAYTHNTRHARTKNQKKSQARLA